MCGVVALFSTDRPIARDALQAATTALRHRGPDGQRAWVAPGGRVGLGHTRLSIIDLTTGAQPIANEDEQVHIVVNGEFYDHERVRAELEGRGHQLQTRSDSEVLVHLYEDYGAQCVSRLRGEFAFVLWDERNQLLLSARDRFGIKPLYYGFAGGTLVVASEAKALFAAGVEARWDHDSVLQQMAIVCDSDRSLFAGVRQVPPGHYLLATRNAIKVVPYWDHDYATVQEPASRLGEAELVEAFRAALLEATRLRLRADVPVGVYLSGGIDSCSLLGMATSLRTGPLDAFNIAFEGAGYDEGPIAEEMARHAGARLHSLRVTEDLCADHFADAVWHTEMFHSNANGTAKYLLSRRVRDSGVKVVLTGEGSDEILGGYPHFVRDMAQHGAGDGARPTGPLPEASTAASKLLLPTEAGARLSTDGVRRALGFVPTWFETQASRGARVAPLLSRDFADRLSRRDPYQMLLDGMNVGGQVAGREPVHQSMYLWTRSYFANMLLNLLGDRAEMAHSVEGRTPFLDHPLVELVTRVPSTMKIRGGTEKYLLREAARPFLTDTVYRRMKQPFVAPPRLRGRLLQLVQDKVRGSSFGAVPFFDRKKVNAFLDRLPHVEDPDEMDRMFHPCLTMLSACVLQERYGL